MPEPVRFNRSADWRFRAACRGADSSLFFAPSYFERREEKLARERRAKEFCHGCEVRPECLAFALEVREAHGVWGGLNEQERRAVLREHALRVG